MIRRELWSCHPSHESRSLQYVRRAWAGGVRVCSAALGGMAARGGTGYLFLPGTVDSERETQRERGPVWGCSATLRGMAARGRAGSFCRGQGNLSIFSILYASIEWYVSTVVHPRHRRRAVAARTVRHRLPVPPRVPVRGLCSPLGPWLASSPSARARAASATVHWGLGALRRKGKGEGGHVTRKGKRTRVLYRFQISLLSGFRFVFSTRATWCRVVL
jgi:hypothetical protein